MDKPSPFHSTFDPKASRAFDQSYVPSKSLQQLVQENPADQFLADRLAEQHAALKEQQAQVNPDPVKAAPVV